MFAVPPNKPMQRTRDWKDRASGKVEFMGIGLDVPSGLTSAWAEPKQASGLGIMVYTLADASASKTAEATWTATDSCGKLGDERIQRQ